jgi:hypothetical protein
VNDQVLELSVFNTELMIVESSYCWVKATLNLERDTIKQLPPSKLVFRPVLFKNAKDTFRFLLSSPREKLGKFGNWSAPFPVLFLLSALKYLRSCLQVDASSHCPLTLT